MLGHHQILINRRCISLGYEPFIVLLQQQSHIIYTLTQCSKRGKIMLCCNHNANIGARIVKKFIFSLKNSIVFNL